MTQRKEFMDELRAFGESFSTRPGGTLILHTLGAIAAPSTANTDDDHDSDNRRSAPRESGLRVNVLMLGGSDGAYRGWSKTFDFKFLNAQRTNLSPSMTFGWREYFRMISTTMREDNFYCALEDDELGKPPSVPYSQTMSLNPSRSRKVVVTLWHKVENKEDYSTVLEFGEEDEDDPVIASSINALIQSSRATQAKLAALEKETERLNTPTKSAVTVNASRVGDSMNKSATQSPLKRKGDNPRSNRFQPKRTRFLSDADVSSSINNTVDTSRLESHLDDVDD